VIGGAMIDELHVIAKSSKAAAALGQITGGMGPFPDAFCLYTTTQSDEPPVGVFAAKLKQAREIRDGTRRGRMLPVLFEFPMSMQLDRAKPWMRPEFWRCVTPNLGRSVHVAGLAEDARVALETSEEEFRRWASQHLNIQIGVALHAHAWAGTRYWEAAGTVGRLKGPEGLAYLLEHSEVITGGIDGGGLDDLLGLVFLGREKDTGRWLVWAHAWVQRDVLEMRKSEAPAFLDFEADGDLTIVDLPGQDVEELADLAERVDASGLFDKFGVDQAGISAIVEALIARGIDLDRIQGVPQGWKLVGAIKTTERKLKSGELAHGGTRLMAYSAGNAKAVPRGNAMMIDKQTCGTAKIDPLMALFDAVTMMTLDPQPRRKDYSITFA
jgi:phage terminase large subunit-like protein